MVDLFIPTNTLYKLSEQNPRMKNEWRIIHDILDFIGPREEWQMKK